MKLILYIAVIVRLSGLWCSAQLVTLTSLDSSGNLGWTNLACTTKPVYEVLQASALAGPWEHLAFVTNQNSYKITNGLNAAAGASFLRVAWVNDEPMVFDYVFQEGGVTTVTGRLEFSFAGSVLGSRSFVAMDEFYFPEISNRLHPLGDAPLGGPVVTPDGYNLKVPLKLGMGGFGEGAIFLDGSLQRSLSGGVYSYTGYRGAVYSEGIVAQQLGVFTATRRN